MAAVTPRRQRTKATSDPDNTTDPQKNGEGEGGGTGGLRGHHYDSRIYTHFQFTEEDKYQEDSNTSHQYTSPRGCVTCTAENTDSPCTDKAAKSLNLAQILNHWSAL